MRKVDRGSVQIPSAMLAEAPAQSLARKELEIFTAYYAALQVSPDEAGKLPSFSVYKSDSVKQRLHELFHGKCAYCESFYSSTAPVDVEHYRPKGRVHEAPEHTGYWWLAMDWDNLLPSCIHCNRRSGQVTPVLSTNLVRLLEEGRRFSNSRLMQSGKQDSFPILGTRVVAPTMQFDSEQALLLDPSRDEPEEHLSFYIDRDNLIGLVLPKPHPHAGLSAAVEGVRPELRSVVEQALVQGVSLKGAVSIHVYGLNRLGLVQERTRLLRHLEFLETLALEISSMADELHRREPAIAKRLGFLRDQIISEMKAMSHPEAPHSMMVRAWIETFKARLRERVPVAEPPREVS